MDSCATYGRRIHSRRSDGILQLVPRALIAQKTGPVIESRLQGETMETEVEVKTPSTTELKVQKGVTVGMDLLVLAQAVLTARKYLVMGLTKFRTR